MDNPSDRDAVGRGDADSQRSRFWRFAAENKAYWIVPLVLILVLLAIVLLTSEAATPFVYGLW